MSTFGSSQMRLNHIFRCNTLLDQLLCNILIGVVALDPNLIVANI
jgi:hypothetical protein